MSASLAAQSTGPYLASPATTAAHAKPVPYTHFTVTQAAPQVGAHISGLDLSTDLPQAVLDELERALAEHGVLFFRGQSLTPEQHIAFSQRFGNIDVNRFFKRVDNYPQIAEVRKEPDQRANIGGGWHTDHSYDEIPAKASALYARDVPDVGGDTLYASTVAAYEALSPGLQATLASLRAVHSSRHVFGENSRQLKETDLRGRVLNPDLATQDAVHPVLFTHPITGRKAIYVNPGFTLRFDGWTEQESQALLGMLYEHIRRPEFTTRFAWQNGSLAIWDNRITWHYAINDYTGHRRLLHRITIQGGALN
jgi:taurine dioxygenase